jgi:hypothetical protein
MYIIWIILLGVGLSLPLAFATEGVNFMINYAPIMYYFWLITIVVIMFNMYSSRNKLISGVQQAVQAITLIGVIISAPMMLGMFISEECTRSEKNTELSFEKCIILKK